MASQPNHSLADGLRCLLELATAGEPVPGSEVARRLELQPVRVNRLLKTLAELGLARQDRRRRYLPGSGLHVLAAVATFGSGLLQRALPELGALAERSGYTVALGVLWQDRVCYLYHGDADTPTAQALGRASLLPASESSIGRRLQGLVDQSGTAVCRHGTAAQPHLSLAVAVGTPPFAALSLTQVPVEADLAPLIADLHACAERIAAPQNQEASP